MEEIPSYPGPAFDVEQSIPARFLAVAAQCSESPAIAGVEKPVTYREVARAAVQLADVLTARAGAATAGPFPERIAILAEHDVPLLIGVLAILLASRAVVVLNPSDPPARLKSIIEDARPQRVLADPAHLAAIRGILPPDQILPLHELLSFDAPVDATPSTRPVASIAPADLAWLIYTSGSTGRPKAVMQTHRNILHNVRRLSQGMRLTPDDRITLCAALSSGQGLSTLWCALLNGAACCPFPVARRGVTGMAAWLETHRISVLVAAGSVFRQLARTIHRGHQFPHMRLLRLAAESATAGDFQLFREHFPPQAVLFHALSSSETGSITAHRLHPGDALPTSEAIPIGRPAPEMEILLLDETGKAVLDGQPGEIVVRSRYISPGYWNNPELTAGRFSAPDGPEGPRLFRSGDMARKNPAGLLEYLGRKDAQVKIHGLRVELSDIEAALAQLPAIERAAVYPFEPEGPESRRLAAFILLRQGQTADADAIRAALRERLPPHMVPACIVFVDAFPLSPSGKIDRHALLSQLSESPPANPATPASEDQPRTHTEENLAAMWAVALRRSPIGRSSDFFSLGGDSLCAALIAALIHDVTGVTLDLRAFADHPRLCDLAAHIDALRPAATTAEPPPPIPRTSSQTQAPLSFTQERIWNNSQRPADSARYTVACSHVIRGPLDVAALRESIKFLHARHDMLRTTFHSAPGGPVQRRHAPSAVPFELPLHDFSHRPNAQAEASAFFRAQSAAPFDLSQWPLLRFVLLRLSPDEHWLLRINHHILGDAISWSIYFRELATLYDARVSGKPTPIALEAEQISYADYATWQRQQFHPETRTAAVALEWWKERFTPRPPELMLPFSRQKSFWSLKPKVTAQDGIHWWGISSAAAECLNIIAAANGATYFMSRLAAFLSFLSRTTGQEDLFLGTYASNRSRIEMQNVFGDFSNLVPLRFRLPRGAPFSDHLASVKQAILDLTPARAQIPFELLRTLVEYRGGNIPQPATIFSISDHTAPLHFAGLEMTWRERISDVIPWGFTLSFTQHAEAGANRAWFDPRLHDPERVRAFLAGFSRFLESELPSIP